jgi:hypothetical protein
VALTERQNVSRFFVNLVNGRLPASTAVVFMLHV